MDGAVSLSGTGGGGQGVRVRNVTVPSGATGRQVNLQRQLGSSSSTFSLLSGSGTRFQLDNGDGLALTSGLAAGASDTALLQETVGSGPTFRQIAYALNCTGAPVAPSVPAVTPTGGDGQISVAWVDGSNGGSPIIVHNIYLNGALIASPTGASPYVITGLANGTPYLVQVSAVNGVNEGALSSPQSVTPSAAPVVGGILAIASMNGPLPTDSGAAPDVSGMVVAITFKGMARRHPINDPAFDASKVTLTVQDPGFDVVGGVITPVTRTRTVKGTLPLKCPWPQSWASLGSAVPARSYCSAVATGGVTRAYYTELGGTKGATAPTHSTDGQTVSDGGVLWTLIPLNQNTGYVETVSGSDTTVYVVLDMPLFAGSTITGISIGGGAYVVGGTSSLATTGAGVTVTNNSQLPYPSVILNVITPPHQRSTGTIRVEIAADHGWGIHIGGGRPIAGIRATAWDMARTNSVSLPDVVSTELSTQYTTSGPGGCAVEVFAPTANTSSLPQGDSFFEFVAYPWLGVPFSTRYDGEGADWRPSQAYPLVGTIVRNGSAYYQLTTAGVSASSGGPTGTTLSTAVNDGTCVWTYIGSDNLIVLSRNPQARWHFYNDPANLLKIGYCFVDPSGTATGTAGVFSSFAAAAAAKGALANCYPTIFAAEAALTTYHNTAGGGLTTHNDSGGGRIYLKAGTHAGFGTALGSKPRGSVWTYVQADPSAAPGTVIFGNGPVKSGHPRMWFGDGVYMTATATGAANIFFDRATDNTTVVKQATGELVISGVNYTPYDATFGIQWRNGWVWLLNSTYSVAANVGDPKQQQYGHALVAGNNLQGPLGQVSVPIFIGNTLFCLTAIRDFSAPTVPVMFTMHLDNRIYGPITSPAGVLVFTLAYNAAGNYGYPTLGYSMRGNLIKSSNYGGCKVAQIAADGQAVPTSNVVITYNSGPGQRYNRAYNDSNNQYHTNWYQGFNAWTSWNTVWDSTGHGVNPPASARCQNYWVVYDVASAYNVSLNGSESGTAPAFNSYSGLRVASTSAPYALGGSITFSSQFVNDTTDVTSSANVSETPGDFRPVAGSVLVNRAAIQAKKFDLLGVARRTDGSGAVGAYERAA